MKTPGYFQSWITPYTAVLQCLLLIMLFSGLGQFASFGLIQPYVVAAFGAQPEDVSMALQISYVGILAGLPIQFRLMQYFNVRNYLLTALLIGITINAALWYTEDLIVFTVLRFFQGMMTAIMAGSMLLVFFSTLPEAKRTLIGSSWFYGTLLSSGIVIGLAASWIVEQTDWKQLYFLLILLQVLSLLICLLIFKPKNIRRPYPLYQIDWVGSVFFAGFALSLAFVWIYGPKYYWFADIRIRYISIIGAMLLLLYLQRQHTLKRPLIDLRIFKNGKFLSGLALLILFYGTRDSINLIYGYLGGILGWSASDVAELGLVGVAGIILATIFSAKVILANRMNLPKLLIGGFIIMIAYHIWIYESLTPDLSFNDLIIPVFLQGVASGLLFVPIIIFTLATVPPYVGLSGIIIAAYARFIASLNSMSGFYTLQLHYNRQYKESFLRHLTQNDAEYSNRLQSYKELFLSKGYAAEQANLLANSAIGKLTAIQGQLLTDRAVFLIGALLMGMAVLALFAMMLVSRIKKPSTGTLAA